MLAAGTHIGFTDEETGKRTEGVVKDCGFKMGDDEETAQLIINITLKKKKPSPLKTLMGAMAVMATPPPKRRKG